MRVGALDGAKPFMPSFGRCTWPASFCSPGCSGLPACEAEPALTMARVLDGLPLGRKLGIVEDDSGKLTLQDVSAPGFAERFVPSQVDAPALGFEVGLLGALHGANPGEGSGAVVSGARLSAPRQDRAVRAAAGRQASSAVTPATTCASSSATCSTATSSSR